MSDTDLVLVSTMKLDEWLKKGGVTEADFAKRIGVKQASVNRYRLRHRTPSPDLIVKIEAVTSGDVTVRDWMSEPAEGAA